VAPAWAREVSWPQRKVLVDLTRETIKSSPPWDTEAAISRQYESALHDHYGRPKYWAGKDAPKGPPPLPAAAIHRS